MLSVKAFASDARALKGKEGAVCSWGSSVNLWEKMWEETAWGVRAAAQAGMFLLNPLPQVKSLWEMEHANSQSNKQTIISSSLNSAFRGVSAAHKQPFSSK